MVNHPYFGLLCLLDSLRRKNMRCGFFQWIDEEWPPRSQQVMLTLWDMVDQFKEKSDCNMVDVWLSVH